MSLIETVILAKEDKSGIISSAVGWIVGSLSFGCVVGWLVRFFLARHEETLTLKVVVSIITGGIVAKFLTFLNFSIWTYCVGLLVGIVAFRWIK